MQPLRFSVSVLFIVRRKNTRLYNPQKQRNVIVNNNGDRIKWSPLLYLTSNKFRICAMMFCFQSHNISLKCSSSFINTF